ncbi:MAG TPA: hypothetical protein VGJ87_14475, partial [Roseiflexaceae bacterium]
MSLVAFDEIGRDVAAAGFQTIEVWRGHAWHATLDEAGASVLRRTMARHRLTPVSYASGLSGPEAEAMMRAARLLGIGLVSGGLPLERASEIAGLARQYQMRIGIENHPERHA